MNYAIPLLIVFRFLCTYFTQTGYIHPDEFFQTIEIAAGDVLKLDVITTWEFTELRPIRSRAVIELFLCIPLRLLRKFFGDVDALLMSRLLMCTISFANDLAIYILSISTGSNYKLAIFLSSVSHISVVFLCRTLSNSWETFLVSLMIICVCWRVNGIVQGAIVALGTFCRPTFAVFTLPYIFWIISHMRSLRRIICYGISGLVGFICVSIVLITVDTYFYNRKDAVIVPWNFIWYNTDSVNLSRHGLHKFYTHIIANVPQLFGPLLFILCYTIRLSTCRFLLMAIGIPVIVLSMFPHQEMRFLLPISMPVFVLSGIVIPSILMKNNRIWIIKAFLVCQILFNGLLILFWGRLHEGGVLPAAGLISHRIQETYNVSHQIISYRTFLVPKFLFKISRNNEKENCIILHNLMGINEQLFWQKIDELTQSQCEKRNELSELHLIFPKAFVFKHYDKLHEIGRLRNVITIRGHINTDLWPPRVPLKDFVSLMYLNILI